LNKCKIVILKFHFLKRIPSRIDRKFENGYSNKTFEIQIFIRAWSLALQGYTTAQSRVTSIMHAIWPLWYPLEYKRRARPW
jgi:hypothetical protein